MAVQRFILCLSLLVFGAVLQARVPADTLLSRLYERAAGLMSEGQYDLAQSCFDSAFAQPGVRRSPFYPVLLNEQATLCVYRGDEQRGLELKRQVLPYLPQMADLEKHVSVYNDLGVLYRRAHETDSALYYYDKALEAALRYGDESWLAHLNMNVSVLLHNLKRPAEAEAYIGRALEYALEAGDPSVSFTVWQVRGSILLAAGHADEAIRSLREAWRMACEADSPEWKIRCLSGFFTYFAETGERDSLAHYLQVGDELLEHLPSASIAAVGYVQARAKTRFSLRQYAEALRDYRWLRSHDTGTDLHTLYADMARCHQALGQWKQAYGCMDSARLWTDSLAQRDLTDRMARLNVKYHMKEQELQNSRLQAQLLQKEAVAWRALAMAGVGLLLAVAVLWAVRHRQKEAERQLRRLRQEQELESARRYVDGMEAECSHIARELHDGIANDLLGMQMQVEAGVAAGEVVRELTAIRREVRAVSHELMPPDLERFDLDDLLARYVLLLSDGHRADISYSFTGEKGWLPGKSVSREVYRMVQEVLANVLKHATATRILVALRVDAEGCGQLLIEDNGTESLSSSAHGQGIGLRTVRHRTKAIGGAAEWLRVKDLNLFELNFPVNTVRHDKR